jgi:hypothetical protein
MLPAPRLGSPLREYIYNGSNVAAKIESGTAKYYQKDILSNRLVTDSTGTVVESLAHMPCGETWYEKRKRLLSKLDIAGLFTALEQIYAKAEASRKGTFDLQEVQVAKMKFSFETE